MIPSDGGGGTAWSSYDIESLHAMVQAVGDDQVSTSWDQVTAWRKTHELLDDHLGTLQYYRQGLVDHWPPDKNAASAAFVTYVDDLITSLQTASQAAKDNERALSDLTSGVVKARDEVKAAYQEYAANKAKLDAYSANSAPSGQPSPSPTPTPSPGPPPVAPGRQEQLTQKARDAMATLSSTATTSSAQMTVPPPYAPPSYAKVESREHLDAPAAVMMTPPVIPAPRTSASHASVAASQVPSAPFPTTATPSGVAPVLTGAVAVLPPTVTPTPPTIVPITPAPSSGPLPGIIGPLGDFVGGKNPTKVPGLPKVGPLSGGADPLSRVQVEARGLPIEGRGLPIEGRGSAGAPTRPLAPGGVIGGSPGSGTSGTAGGRAGGPRSNPVGRPRPNPVGGVLGQGGGTTAGQASEPTVTRGAAGGTVAGQPPLPGQRRAGSSRDDGSQRWDPDNPWAMEHGVAPILQPGSEPSSHEPGPGVIGIDR